MEKQTYQGWTNYATWRVMLEIFDGMELSEFSAHFIYKETDPYDLSKELQEYVELMITDYKSETSLAQDYALAFLSDVNWYEIAQHLINDYEESHADHS